MKWFKNGKEIKPDEHIEITVEGTLHTLKVNNANMNDDAEYTCKVDQENTSAYLHVEGMWYCTVSVYKRITHVS